MEKLSFFKSSVITSKELYQFLNNEEKKSLTIIVKEIESVITAKDVSDKKLKDWFEFFDKFIKNLESNPLSKKKLIEEEQIKLVNRLLTILKEFIGINATVPGTNGKSVGEFIKELENSKTNLEESISEKIALNKSIDICSDILRYLGNVATAYAQMPKISDEEDALTELLNQKNDIEKRITTVSKEMVKIEDEFQSIPENQRIELLSLKEHAKREYKDVKNEKESLENKIKELKAKIEASTQLIKDLEKIAKSSVKLDKQELKTLYNNTQIILRNLGLWTKYVSSVNLNELTINGNKEKEAEKFYSALGEYFADVLKVIYFENKGWLVKKVDLLNHRYIVDEREPIDFVDFGTGHNQLNAFMARLKQNYGGRKKIVLFDELGVMDKNNVARLLDEIKKQVKSGELMFALLTQVDDNLDKVVMEPVKI